MCYSALLTTRPQGRSWFILFLEKEREREELLTRYRHIVILFPQPSSSSGSREHTVDVFQAHSGSHPTAGHMLPVLRFSTRCLSLHVPPRPALALLKQSAR